MKWTNDTLGGKEIENGDEPFFMSGSYERRKQTEQEILISLSAFVL